MHGIFIFSANSAMSLTSCLVNLTKYIAAGKMKRDKMYW